MWNRQERPKKFGQRVALNRGANFCESCSSTLLNIRSLYASKKLQCIVCSSAEVTFFYFSYPDNDNHKQVTKNITNWELFHTQFPHRSCAVLIYVIMENQLNR